jgi:transposase
VYTARETGCFNCRCLKMSARRSPRTYNVGDGVAPVVACFWAFKLPSVVFKSRTPLQRSFAAESCVQALERFPAISNRCFVRIHKDLEMCESLALSRFTEGTMPAPYSTDLRERVIAAVIGGASRREAAEEFRLSPSVVIIWMQRFEATGCFEPRRAGGSVSPLEEHEEFILGLIKEKPDMILDEIVKAMSKAKISSSRTAVWRFLDRHGITVKKRRCSQRSKSGPIAHARGDVGNESRACLTPHIWCL